MNTNIDGSVRSYGLPPATDYRLRVDAPEIRELGTAGKSKSGPAKD
jgi:hypothetical protein